MKIQHTAGRVDQLWPKTELCSQLHCLKRPDTPCCKDPAEEQ